LIKSLITGFTLGCLTDFINGCKVDDSCLFERVVAVAFQNVFHSKINQNNIFLKLFLILAYQNNLKT
jgi:hypothetical protein